MSAEITISKSLTISQTSRGAAATEAGGTFAKEFEKQLTITTDNPEQLEQIFEHLEDLKDKEKGKTALEKLLELFFGIDDEAEEEESYDLIKNAFMLIAGYECDCEKEHKEGLMENEYKIERSSTTTLTITIQKGLSIEKDLEDQEYMKFLQKELHKVITSPMLTGFEDKTEDIKNEFEDNPTFNTAPEFNLDQLSTGGIDVASLIG